MKITMFVLLALLMLPLSNIFAEDCSCYSEFAKRWPDQAAKIKDTSTSCFHLAGAIGGERLDPFSGPGDSVVPKNIVQPADNRQTETQGSVGQSSAVPGVEPTAITAGSFGLAGTAAGTKTVAAISINPSLFTAQSSKSFAVASRFSDITVFLPVSFLGGGNPGKLDFIGVNARINLTGPMEGRLLFEKQKELMRQTFNKALTAETKDIGRLAEQLKKSPDVCGCAALLLSEKPDRDSITRKCGAAMTVTSGPYYDTLRTQSALLQQMADAEYFGFDLRFAKGITADTGIGLSFFCGVAGGKRYDLTTTANVSLRAWLGLFYADPDTASPSIAAQGAVGAVLKRSLGPQPVEIGAGVEGRYGVLKGNDTNAVNQPNAVRLRISLNAPFAGGSGIALSFSAPLYGNEKPEVNVNYQWSLRLPENMLDAEHMPGK
jgi:hypothetical protein